MWSWVTKLEVQKTGIGKATDKCQSEAVRANIGIQGLPQKRKTIMIIQMLRGFNGFLYQNDFRVPRFKKSKMVALEGPGEVCRKPFSELCRQLSWYKCVYGLELEFDLVCNSVFVICGVESESSKCY